MIAVLKAISGSNLKARFIRSSFWTLSIHLTSQVIRLGSNLILTRLLYPEAFGLMALVMVFIIGLEMFSDVGITPSIQRSENGDDQNFLDTAWTLQIIRGFCLWVFCCLLAYPISEFYNEPFLFEALPIAGISLVIAGFKPTRMISATRHLRMGRLAILSLISQIIGVLIAIFLVWNLRSPWGLVVSGVIASALNLIIMTVFLPGTLNRLCWDKAALLELFKFGRWILLSTFCAFFLTQGDKAILGKYLNIDILGIYNVGFFLATFPIALAMSLTGRILVPLYRERPPTASTENFKALRKMRFALTGGTFTLLLPLMYFGSELVEILYDNRFFSAGAIVIVLACIQIPNVVSITYEQVILAAGNSRIYFLLQLYKAIFYVLLLWFGVRIGGLPGALIGLSLYYFSVYPAIVLIANRYGAWDWSHDFFWLTLGILASAGGIMWNYDFLYRSLY